MTQPEETPVSFIPPNFIEKGKILNGTFDIRNAIESIVLSLAIGIPVFHLPLSLTARIIILCMTALPAAMVALIGIGGESITAFLMNALRFVVNRRVIWRSDSLPEGKPRRKPRFKEPKTKKHRKAEQMAEPSKVMASAPPQSEPDAPAPPKSKKKEHRQFDTSTKRGIKKQAKEDIRYLKWEQKEASRQKKDAVFSTTFGRAGEWMLTISIALFAFATIIAWEYQGEKAFEYLAGNSRRTGWYRMCYGMLAFFGAICSLEAVWDFSDICNGLMAVPNRHRR